MGKKIIDKQFLFLQAGGELGAMTREFDWASTAVGPVGTWPQSLLCTVSTLLHAKAPMFLWWGNELTQFYNDAYRPSLGSSGKHPTALGQRGEECWPEIWPVIKPLIDQVMYKGEPVWVEDQLIPIYRNGHLEDVYWTFGYSCVLNDDGKAEGVLVICNETTEKIKALKELQLHHQNLENLVQQAPVGMCIMEGKDHVVTVANSLIVEIWGKPINEVMNRPIFEALPDAKGQGLEELINDVYQTGNPFSASERPVSLLRNGTTETVYQNFVYEPYRDVNGQIKGVIAITVNVTDQVIAKQHLEQSERELLETKQHLEQELEAGKQMQQRKDEFLSIASHELKTPLTSIKAFNQIMLRSNSLEQMHSFNKRSAENIHRLEKLISDLLDVTKINLGKISYNFETFDFGKMLEESINSLQQTTKHTLVLTESCNTPYTGDRIRLEQVISNLITNAVKYSPEANRVVISCKCEHEGLVVGIQDFGIGIAPADINRLFDRYYRVDNTSMRFEGLGLGLYITSEILNRHNGSFWIESEVGKGSIFHFRLPIASEKTAEVIMQTPTKYLSNTIRIAYDAENEWLDVDWTGYQNMDTVKQGCLLMLDYLSANTCTRVVNDNTRVMGNWSDAVDWVGEIWFPMMAKAGLKYFAHIFSPSTFSKLSAQKSIDIMAGIVTTQYFTEKELAEKWIASCPQ